MRRFNYNINGIFSNKNDLFDIYPSFFYETVPGETWQGVVKHKMVSEAVADIMYNRIFFDHYVFYVPFRLLWDEWPLFITQRASGDNEGDQSVPTEVPTYTVAGFQDTINNNFYAKQPIRDNAAAGHAVNSLPIRAYNMIYNLFFRQEGATTVGTFDTPTIQRSFRTSRGFHEASLLQTVDNPETIDTSGASITVDAVREAFAKDQFNKIRDYYGDKYIDFLRAMGVQANWAVAETPELIGKVSKPCNFQIIGNTAKTGTEQLGEKGGYYDNRGELKIKKTFCPEHGFIMGINTIRMEAPLGMSSHPSYSKLDPEQYWTPERDSQKAMTNYASLFQQNDAGAYNANYEDTVAFQDYRHGVNLSDNPTVASGGNIQNFFFTQQGGLSTDGQAQVAAKYLNPSDAAFNNAFFDEATNKFSSMFITQLRKASPISKVVNTPIR